MTTDDLKTKARFLRNAAPRAFDEFYGAFAEYTDSVTDVLFKVTDRYELYQGHAQQCVKLRDLLEEVKNG